MKEILENINYELEGFSCALINCLSISSASSSPVLIMSRGIIHNAVANKAQSEGEMRDDVNIGLAASMLENPSHALMRISRNYAIFTQHMWLVRL
jgi:hypothetical protein